jgi:hypothetical protein
MTNARRSGGLMLSAMLLLAGCVSGGAVQTSPPGASDPRPTDTTVAPVSASTMSSDWAKFLDACGVIYSLPGHDGKGLGTSIVSGAGVVAHARDMVRYAAVGPQPEIQTDAPAWVITTKGWFAPTLSDTANGIESLDPTCYAVGDPANVNWVSTGGVRQGTVVETPLPFPPPVARLPQLLP